MIDSETRAVLAKTKGLIAKSWGQANDDWSAFTGPCINTSLDIVAGYTAELLSALRILTRAIGGTKVTDLYAWNDAPGRTQAEVIDLFDRVLADNPAPTLEPIPDLVA